MADTEQVEEVAEEGEAPAAGKGRLPLIALAVVGLAVGAGTGAMVLGPILARSVTHAPAKAPSDSTEEEAEPAVDEHGKPIEGKPVNAPSVHLIENLVLNPAESGGSRFLLLSIALECNDAKTLATFQARDAELKDIILSKLGTKNVDQLTDVAYRDQIKPELLVAISEHFGKKSVKRLYFPQFVVQ